MNSSLDNYLVNGQMARNKVRVKRQYQVSELNTPIQCSDRIAFEVGRVLFNLTFGNTP